MAGGERAYRVLDEVIAEHGPAITADRVRTRGLLLDSLGAIERPERSAVAALLSALDDGVPDRVLAGDGAATSLAAEATALSQRGDLAPGDATRAVQAWASSLRGGPAPGQDADLSPAPAPAPAPKPVGPPPATPVPGSGPPARATRNRTRLLLGGGIALIVVILLITVPPSIAKSGAHVRFLGARVAVYEGRPGGFLWADPYLDHTTGVVRDDLSDDRIDEIEAGVEFDDLDEAEDFVEELEVEAEEIRAERLRAEAEEQLNRFVLVSDGGCTPVDPIPGQVLQLYCEYGPYRAWIGAWESDEAMIADADDRIASQTDAFSDRWNDRGGTERGTLTTFVYEGTNWIHWTYEDETPFAMSVEGFHSGNDAVELRRLWAENLVGLDE